MCERRNLIFVEERDNRSAGDLKSRTSEPIETTEKNIQNR